MRTNLSVLILTITFFLSSCDNRDFETNQLIRITNFTDFIIEGAEIHSLGDQIAFNTIYPGSITNFKPIVDLHNESAFVFILNDTSFIRSWTMPILESTDQVPTQVSTHSPSGKYTFGIFSDDSIISSMFIGLVEYSIE